MAISFVQKSETTGIAVLIPGIMGSQLTRNGAVLWGENLVENYQLLMGNPGALVWTGEAAEAELLRHIRVGWKMFPLKKADLWGAVFEYLGKSPKFGPASLWPVGYDWRNDLVRSGGQVAEALESRLSEPLDAPPRSPKRLTIIAHSMGGLLMRAAVGTGRIHPGWLDKIVFIGTPHAGAPASFRTIYDQVGLPFFNEVLSFLRAKNKAAFERYLQQCLGTFPSIYQMFPWREHRFLSDELEDSFNPLTRLDLPGERMELASQFHELLKSGDGILRGAKVRCYSIFSQRHGKKKTDLTYVVERQGQRGYRLLEVTGTTHEGDGTVPAYSARGIAGHVTLPVMDADHPLMCDDDRVVQCLNSAL